MTGLELVVLEATADELDAHGQMLKRLSQSTGALTLWEEIETPDAQ